MAHVDLLALDDDAKQVPVVRFHLRDKNRIDIERLRGEGDITDAFIEKEFVLGRSAKLYSIKRDGLNFLKALKYHFSGTYLRATDVIV